MRTEASGRNSLLWDMEKVREGFQEEVASS
jgi:hypothetical protein